MIRKDERRIFRIASLLFFLSGLAGLAYEVIWFKRFSHVWGNSSLAMAAVVASFLLGLALGAQRFGKWADQWRYPIQWYAVCEAGIGILALLIPFEISGLMGIASLVYPYVSTNAFLYTFLRMVLTFIILGPPCFLMGGTLPLLIKQFTTDHSTQKEASGWFYAINTLGAALGCYLTGFHLLPSLGLLWTNSLIAALNLYVAMESYFVARELKNLSNETPESPAEGVADALFPIPIKRNSLSVWVLYFISSLTGCAALILEMVWARQLSLILGGTTYAFSAMLFVILIGIGLGSLGFHWFQRWGCRHDTALITAILLLILFTLAGYLSISQLSLIVGYMRDWRANPGMNAVVCISVSAILELVPAISMGFLFPLLISMMRQNCSAIGKTVGNLYSWNTVGSILGASFTSLILIHYLGSAYTIALALSMYAAAILLWTPYSQSRFRAVVGCVIGIGLMVGGGVFFKSFPAPNPLITNVGLFMYGSLPIPTLLSVRNTLFFEEGAACNVLVTENDGALALRVNGKVDASNTSDMTTQLGSCYFPYFLNPQSRDILVIGFGSGTTSGAALLFPHTRVTCCEIEPAVFAASKYFSSVNHSPEKSPNFTMVFDDGRNYLQGARERYDLIISEPSNPWMAGLANLFTREFYQAAKKRLKPGGIFTQWIQIYSFTLHDYAMMVRTIRDVFPHTLLLITNNSDTLLLASEQSLTPSRQRLQTAQAVVDSLPAVAADLEKYFNTKDVVSLFIKHLFLDPKGLEQLAQKDAAVLLHTDLNMQLEFDAPLRLLIPSDRQEDVTQKLLAFADPLYFIMNFDLWGCGKEQLQVWKDLTGRFSDAGVSTSALALARFGSEKFPDEPHFMAEQLKWMPSDQTESFTEKLNQLLPRSLEEAFRIGLAMEMTKQPRRALEVFDGITRQRPEYVTPWVHLAISYQALKMFDQAEETFQKALKLDPFNGFTNSAYNVFQDQKKKKK